MGNCVRREVGFEVEDNTDAPPAPEIIDKIVLLKKKTKRKQKVPVEENLNNIEINDTPIEEIKPVKEVPRPPREGFPEPIEEPIQKEEPPRKSRRIYLGDYVSEDKRQHVTIRDSENLREDNLNLYI